MAQLIDGFDFIGRLGDITAYKMKGCKRTVLRRCGGPSAKQIKSDPRFKTVRLNGKEFGARSKAMSVFVKMLQPHKGLADYNYSQAVSARMKVLQDFDEVHALGRRSILFSQYPELWEGFSLNETHGFDSMVLPPLSCVILRETLSAQVEIPELIPGMHLSVPESQPLFRIQAALGILPDFVYRDSSKRHVPSIAKERIAPAIATTPWMPCLGAAPAATLEMTLPDVPVTEGFALMVSIGICFGVPVNRVGKVTQLVNAGAAKVLMVE